MKSKRRFLCFAVSLSIFSGVGPRVAGTKTSGPPSSTAPPKFLTMFHQEIKPGKDGYLRRFGDGDCRLAINARTSRCFGWKL